MTEMEGGDIHSYDDLSLILKSKEIQSPKPKTDTLDIPGADGEEDLTEYFGSVKYKNRKLTFNFSTIVPMKDFLELFSTVQNAVHGKKMRIILDDDPEFYYVGRLTCDKWKANKRIGTIKIEGNCEPYKYKLYKTVINEVIGEVPVEIVCKNLKRNVVPTFTVNAAMQITFKGANYAVSPGTFQIPEVEFVAGVNLLTVSGAGNIKIEYQEASL